MIESRRIGDVLFEGFIYVFIALFVLFCLLPFWVMVVGSFTDNQTLIREGYRLWPSEWSIEAYKVALQGQGVLVGYQVSILVTVVGTLGSVTVMAGLGYVLSVKRFKARSKLALLIFFTMIFSGGLVPWFVVVRRVLHLKDSIWALIIPPMVAPFWVFVMRNFFSGLPKEIIESAYIDGASDARILFEIVLPLSKPVLATVALFMAVGYWNDWFHGVMLLDFVDYRPLAVLLMRIIFYSRALVDAMSTGTGGVPIDSLKDLPTRTIRLATACITLGPIVLLYPFAQKYFIKGLTVGAIKG